MLTRRMDRLILILVLLGATLYFLTTGTNPFPSRNEGITVEANGTALVLTDPDKRTTRLAYAEIQDVQYVTDADYGALLAEAIDLAQAEAKGTSQAGTQPDASPDSTQPASSTAERPILTGTGATAAYGTCTLYLRTDIHAYIVIRTAAQTVLVNCENADTTASLYDSLLDVWHKAKG